MTMKYIDTEATGENSRYIDYRQMVRVMIVMIMSIVRIIVIMLVMVTAMMMVTVSHMSSILLYYSSCIISSIAMQLCYAQIPCTQPRVY
jgi:hypothetical protein